MRSVALLLPLLALSSGALACARTTGAAPREGAAPPGAVREVTPDALEELVRSRKGETSACLESATRRTPRPSGKIVVRFTIQPDGSVRDVYARVDTLAAPEATACLVIAFGSWQTPFRPGAPATVEHAFVFPPGE